MLRRINELLDNNTTFEFETTLATKSYRIKILEAKEKKYKINLLFFWLSDVALAIERVRIRVLEGGHNIEPAIIKRRYIRGIKNLFEIYMALADEVVIFDNSEDPYESIAEKSFNKELIITDTKKFNYLKNYYNEIK